MYILTSILPPYPLIDRSSLGSHLFRVTSDYCNYSHGKILCHNTGPSILSMRSCPICYSPSTNLKSLDSDQKMSEMPKPDFLSFSSSSFIFSYHSFFLFISSSVLSVSLSFLHLRALGLEKENGHQCSGQAGHAQKQRCWGTGLACPSWTCYHL